LPDVETVLLVGHEPSLSSHVRRLIGLPVPTALPLAKGAVARVDTEDRRGGALRLLIGPKQLS
jgi:phosphohistidine phosphatase SixA